MTGAQRLSKMMDSFDKWAETEGAVQKYKIDKEHELQQMRMKLKHEREMAKIKFNSEKLSLEREKMALRREQLCAEAAAHGQDPSSFPSGGVMENPMFRMETTSMHVFTSLTTDHQYR